MLNIDIEIYNKDNNKKVVIEFNGPNHYIKCEGVDVESGRTKFKRRLMEGLGFTVLSIHWDDWRGARENDRMQAFLTKLLND